jgi:hypothetical protein
MSVQGNGEVCAQSVQIPCMYREARIYRERLFTGYTICTQYRMIEKCMDRPTVHESVKLCNETVLLGNLAS